MVLLEGAVLKDVPAGKYTWAVAIVDTSRDDKPSIELAANCVRTDDLWYKIKEVTVK